jgi:hypothetical protein
MAPNKSRRSKPDKAKQATRKPKTKRVLTRSTSGAGGKSAMNSDAGGPPAEASRLAANRLDFPISLSLSNLVRLDWDQRQELFPHGPGISKLERFGFKGRAYSVESLELGATGNKFVYLYPEKRYYVVPIYEAGQSSNAPQRFLLVRNRDDQEEPGPHIFVVEPPGPSAPDDPFAHLYLISNEDDGTATEPLRHAAGIVVAVLAAVETGVSGQLTESPTTTPSQQTKHFVPSAAVLLDEDLLSSIDVLAIAQSSRPDAAKDFNAAHNKFLEYVQDRFDLENIPISLEQTMFDPALGHNAAATVSNPALPDGVIVGVLRDGYRREHKVVREAIVVVNKHAAKADAGPPLVIDAPLRTMGVMPDFLGISQLTVQNRVYNVKPIVGDAPVQLRLDQTYRIVRLEDAPRGEWRLIRKVGPDQAKQLFPELVEANITGIVEAALIPEWQTTTPQVTGEQDIVPVESYQLIMVAPDRLRMTVNLPSLIPVREFLNDIPRRLEAINAFYLLFSLIATGETEAVRELMAELAEDKSTTAVINPVLRKHELNQSFEPLQLIRFHYGSDVVTDLLGIGKIVETIVSFWERLRKGKYDEELLKREVGLKDEEVLAKRAERRKIEIQNFRASLAALSEARDLALSDEEIRQLYDLSMSTSTPLIDPPTHESYQHRILRLQTQGAASEPKALPSPKIKPTNSMKKARRRNR